MSLDQPTAPAARVEAVSLEGGRLCLDLANTVDPRRGDHPRDHLVHYEDLLAWGRRTGVLTAEGEQTLRDRAAREPDEAAATLERAKDLREVIYRIFSATATHTSPAAADLDALRRAYASAARRAHFIRDGGAFRWEWPTEDPRLDDLLWPVAYSAVELLTSPELVRVKECPGVGDCGWLFLDETKNGSRRWCSMETCGSRAKMRRHYAKQRASKGAESGEAEAAGN